jgi:hypothetical protein
MTLREALLKLADETERLPETLEQAHANLRALAPWRDDLTLDEEHALSDAHICALLDAFEPLEKALGRAHGA